MLQAVLADPGLQKFGEYSPADVDGLSVDGAVVSENAVIHAVGGERRDPCGRRHYRSDR